MTSEFLQEDLGSADRVRRKVVDPIRVGAAEQTKEVVFVDEHQFSDAPFEFWEFVGRDSFMTQGGWRQQITLTGLCKFFLEVC